ncbi:TPA: ECF transporter S component [Streptococcus agalactiae]
MIKNSTLTKLTRVAILSALCVVLRYAFAPLPNIQPITAIFLIIVVLFDLKEGVATVTITMLVSSFLMGFGPWVFLQIISFALILCLWKFLIYPLTKAVCFGKITEVVLQTFFAGGLGVVYGVIIDTCFAWLYHMPWWTYVLAGLSFNMAHALSTCLFYPLLLPILRRFRNEKIH